MFWWVNLVGRIMDPVVIMFCLMVVFYYSKSAIRNRKPATAHEWLILGIVLGFAAKVFDNGFWTFFWAGHLLQRPWTEYYIEIGPAAVLVFRQLSTIAAAFCHVMGCWLLIRDRGGEECPETAWTPVLASIAGAIVITFIAWALAFTL